MLNYYRRFMPGIANRLVPLHGALAAAGKSKAIVWTDQCDEAFRSSKKALSSATLLHHPDPQATTALTVDASDVAVGTELSQLQGDGWVPVAFFSKKLQPPERKCSAFDRELLAMFLSTKYFRHFLEGRPFTIFPDHKPRPSPSPWAVPRTDRRGRHGICPS